jgi:hypothetical protein
MEGVAWREVAVVKTDEEEIGGGFQVALGSLDQYKRT